MLSTTVLHKCGHTNDRFDPCHMYYPLDDSTCSNDTFNTTHEIRCEKYVYDDSIFEETLTSKLDLVNHF